MLTFTYAGRGYQLTPACYRRVISFIFKSSSEGDYGRRLVAGRFSKYKNRDSRVDAFVDVEQAVGKEPPITVAGSRQRRNVLRM